MSFTSSSTTNPKGRPTYTTTTDPIPDQNYNEDLEHTGLEMLITLNVHIPLPNPNPIQVRTMHAVTNHAHCCYARLFAQRATQPSGRPPTVLAKQTSTIIISSTSSSLLQTTPTVYCATPVSVILQAKKQDTTHVIYKFINN